MDKKKAGPNDGKKVLAPPATRSRLDACGQAGSWRGPPNFSCLRPAFYVRVLINSIFHKTERSDVVLPPVAPRLCAAIIFSNKKLLRPACFSAACFELLQLARFN